MFKVKPELNQTVTLPNAGKVCAHLCVQVSPWLALGISLKNMKTESDIQPFVDLFAEQSKARLIAEGMTWEIHASNYVVHCHMGKKFARVDIGGSGKYMVDLETGTIYGIKGYGVVHRGHVYGTLDTINDWDWSGYTAIKKAQVAA